MVESGPTVGVLALQRDFRDHSHALHRAGAAVRLVRLPEDLDRLHGLVMPGGESTTSQILLERKRLCEPLGARVAAGLPTLATCAGLILLARQIVDGRRDQRGLDLLDVAVRRNGYGSQVDSFEAPVQVLALGDDFPGVFIRAPVIEEVGAAEVFAEQDGRPVGVCQGGIIGLCFHPELTQDFRIHIEFVRMSARFQWSSLHGGSANEC
jgi:5'-phosphate synthase pdxT subunit